MCRKAAKNPIKNFLKFFTQNIKAQLGIFASFDCVKVFLNYSSQTMLQKMNKTNRLALMHFYMYGKCQHFHRNRCKKLTGVESSGQRQFGKS